MNVTMTSRHLNTLSRLMNIAQKHNCVISFGVNDNSGDVCDWDLIQEQTKASDKVIDTIKELVHTENNVSQTLWFELYDKTNKTYNVLSYTETHTWFLLEDENEEDDKVDDWIRKYSVDYNSDRLCYFDWQKSNQSIKGFRGIDTSKICVYREGMALKFFGDLVCDYLGEEHIEEVY